jgi:hypothetical protein
MLLMLVTMTRVEVCNDAMTRVEVCNDAMTRVEVCNDAMTRVKGQKLVIKEEMTMICVISNDVRHGVTWWCDDARQCLVLIFVVKLEMQWILMLLVSQLICCSLSSIANAAYSAAFVLHDMQHFWCCRKCCICSIPACSTFGAAEYAAFAAFQHAAIIAAKFQLLKLEMLLLLVLHFMCNDAREDAEFSCWNMEA